MNNEIEKLKGKIEILKITQYLFTVSGTAFSFLGILRGAIHLVSPQPETFIDYLPAVGILAVGIVNLCIANGYLKIRKTAEEVKDNMENLNEAIISLQEREKVEVALNKRIGPNIPIFIRLRPPKKGLR